MPSGWLVIASMGGCLGSLLMSGWSVTLMATGVGVGVGVGVALTLSAGMVTIVVFSVGRELFLSLGLKKRTAFFPAFFAELIKYLMEIHILSFALID